MKIVLYISSFVLYGLLLLFRPINNRKLSNYEALKYAEIECPLLFEKNVNAGTFR